jgi:hypothetical protein
MKQKTEAQAIFLYPFEHHAKQKVVFYPFVDKETNGSYSFANSLKRLGHLCPRVMSILVGWEMKRERDRIK